MSQKKIFTTPPRRVALFITCMVDMMYPEVGIATTELLERHGIEVVFPFEQTCCGQPAFNAGYRDDARQLADRFLDIFWPMVQNGTVDAVVAPSGSCTTMTTHFYPMLYETGTEGGISVNERQQRKNQAEALAAVTFELTEFLVDVLGITDVEAHFKGKFTYHACCHLLRELKVDQQPRALLENVADGEQVTLEEAEECCGFGGLFSVKNADISTSMGMRKVRNIEKSGADVVTMCDVSCMTHINGLLNRQKRSCRAVHIAELLNNQLLVKQPDNAERAVHQQAQPPAAKKPRRWQEG